MDDKMFKKDHSSGLCSLVAGWNSYGVPSKMVSYYEDVSLPPFDFSKER